MSSKDATRDCLRRSKYPGSYNFTLTLPKKYLPGVARAGDPNLAELGAVAHGRSALVAAGGGVGVGRREVQGAHQSSEQQVADGAGQDR